MNGKRVALFGALWIGLCLSCGRVWAQAYQVSGGETRGRTASPKYASQLAAFTSKFDLKSEATFKIGPAIPMGDFKALTGASGIAQGAGLGVALDLSYQYYFVPYFGLGVALGAQIFGYDFNTAIQGEYPGKMQKTGWEVYSAGLSLNVRIPIISKLYLIGQVQRRLKKYRSMTIPARKSGPTAMWLRLSVRKAKWISNWARISVCNTGFKRTGWCSYRSNTAIG